MTQSFRFGSKTYIMAIMNVTTDSFSGDGIANNSDLIKTAIEKADAFRQEGADILDIGGESTRPGAEPVNLQEEMDHVIPVIQAIRQRMDIPISVDTYKSEVAQAALAVGANWINDVWGLRADANMAAVAAVNRTPIILMHNRSKIDQAELQHRLGGRYINVPYQNLMQDVKHELMESVQIARTAGVEDENIILDPGIGFGKTVNQNLELIDRLNEIKQLGFPLLLGPSRKSFIGYTLNLPPEDRLEGTCAACAVGILRGADILRVHDVKAIARMTLMIDAIVRRL